MRLTIYVPRPGSQAAAHLVPGSAVVGDPTRAVSGILTCWYEGNVGNRAVNLRDFFSKLSCAAGRLAADYPTIAADGFRLSELTAVGTFDTDRNVVVEVSDPEALLGWCGEGPERVRGPLLPPGPAAWADAARLAQPPHSSPVGAQEPDSDRGMWFRTQAGQYVRFRLAAKEAEVFDHDDPALGRLLPPVPPGQRERGQAPGPRLRLRLPPWRTSPAGASPSSSA